MDPGNWRQILGHDNQDYLRRKMLSLELESKLQSAMANSANTNSMVSGSVVMSQQHQQAPQQQSLQPNQIGVTPQLEPQKQPLLPQQRAVSETSSVDSGQTPQSAVVDQQEVVWTKLQSLREKYLQDMKNLLNMLVARCQQAMPPEQLHKLKHYKEVLSRMIPYLSASRSSLPKEIRLDKVELFEKQIVSLMETFKKRKFPQKQQTPATSAGGNDAKKQQSDSFHAASTVLYAGTEYSTA